jgi:hypothetical protein
VNCKIVLRELIPHEILDVLSRFSEFDLLDPMILISVIGYFFTES